MKKKKSRKGRDQGCHIAKDLRTPKYRKRVVPDKKRQENRNKCRKDIEIMTEEELIAEYRERYNKACHGMMCGVGLDIELGVNQSHSPKHLRTGVNSAMVEHGGLVKLLMDKGVITEVEYYKALCEAMEQEHRRYEELLSKHTGTKMVLV